MDTLFYHTWPSIEKSFQQGGTRLVEKIDQYNRRPGYISVITIAYNAEKTIEKTIRSLLDQKYPKLEYIIIDGGSADGTLEIIRKYESQIDYWISEPDKGISDAFNKGIRLARGEVIGLLNADDWHEPETLHKVMTKIGSNDLIYGKINYWVENTIINVKAGNHKTMLNGLRGMTMPHPATFIKSSLYQQVGLYNTEYINAMDYEFLLRALYHNAKCKRISAVLTNFRSGGVTSTQRLNTLEEEKRAKIEVLKMSPFKAQMQFFLKYLFIFILGPLVHRLPLNRLK